MSNPIHGTRRGPLTQTLAMKVRTIDWQQEKAFERKRTESLRHIVPSDSRVLAFLQKLFGHHVVDTMELWMALLLTGIGSGLAAGFIDVVSLWLTDAKFGFCKGHPYLTRNYCCSGQDQCELWFEYDNYILAWLVYLLFTVLFSVVAAVLITYYSPEAKMSGIPQIKAMLSGLYIPSILSPWTLLSKTLGLCLVVGAGLWVGKEGPLVHVACNFAWILSDQFASTSRSFARKASLLIAASAAGIAIAFDAPIGGVLFSIEALSYYVDSTMWQSFVCATAAVMSLAVVNPFRSNKLVLFQVIYTSVTNQYELPVFAILGVFGGLYGTYFNKLNLFFAKSQYFKKIKSKPVIEVAILAFVTAIVTYPDMFLRENSDRLLQMLFDSCPTDDTEGMSGVGTFSPEESLLCSQPKPASFFLLIFAAVFGSVLASYSFGVSVPAGVIMPSLLVGGLMGRAVGLVVEACAAEWPQLFGCPVDGGGISIGMNCGINPGVYALVGASSALTGVTRVTVSAVVIMFELTGALSYVLPMMIGVMISKWVADSFERKGIYELWISHLQYPVLFKNDEAAIPDVDLKKLITCRLVKASRFASREEKVTLLNTPFRGFPVVESTQGGQEKLVGFVTRSALGQQLDVDDLVTIADNPFTLDINSSLLTTTQMMMNLGLRCILFIDTFGSVKGLLTRKDLWAYFEQSGKIDWLTRRAFESEEIAVDDIEINDNEHDALMRDADSDEFEIE